MIERGKYNEILASVIGKDTVISGWTYIGSGCIIGDRCHFANFIDMNNGTVVGDDVNIQAFFECNSYTVIGPRTMIGAYFTTADEKYMSPDTKSLKRKPCVIGSDVIIGTHVVLVSCTIGDGAVIGAKSLVMQDVPPNEVWVGVPAKPLMKDGKVMTRSDYDVLLKNHQLRDLT